MTHRTSLPLALANIPEVLEKIRQWAARAAWPAADVPST